MTDQQDISITLLSREVVGKGVKNLRRQGQTPAVIHDHGKPSIHVMAPYVELSKIYQQAGKHHPVNLTVDGKKYLALIKDVDFEPRKNLLRHIVFNAIEQNKAVETEVPVTFLGDAEAEKAGLMVLRQIDTVEVKALPKDLPNEVTVDISGLTEVGDKLHVSDIIVPAGVEIITEPEHALAVVEESAAVQAAAAEEAEAADAAAEAAANPDAEVAQPTEGAEASKETAKDE
ncbi:MAG: 50S ribosomal protein L25 [Candidatus Saccharimonadales bacterium]